MNDINLNSVSFEIPYINQFHKLTFPLNKEIFNDGFSIAMHNIYNQQIMKNVNTKECIVSNNCNAANCTFRCGA